MEERERAVSSFAGPQRPTAKSGIDQNPSSLMESPASKVLPQVMNMAISMSIERNLGSSSSDSVKKKRGRPRKYAPDGSLALALTPEDNNELSLPSSPFLFSSKRGRGRPPGSGKRQLLATLGEWVANSAGGNFTPHVITISTGEDVATKILSFSQKGPRSICILSANGAISNVTLRQPGSSGGTLTYEGRFEILSLSGSFTLADNGGSRTRTGGISISLAGPDGRVIGGGVAGLLLAASPIQVVVGSFTPNSQKDQKRKHMMESSTPSPLLQGGITPAVPLSHMTPPPPSAEETHTTTTNKSMPSPTANNQANITKPSLTSLHSPTAWSGSQSTRVDPMLSTDINMCLPGE
ncbi:AT-hook motif nuclear-localized protein 1 [Amborella trichopoda]|uniref:AT-hook motif nuclear-localized protein n=1 Tax=Amborella trichopoda TaxID=13333 RepID=W1PYY9_AMBTC|nr:AT-hook motif nuclear-localized protein 1 [Amborella trichopoda]ERN13221.1 hypothetical protein AMTR_s00040p00224930 [Amborella trichopoda]|eukprot:XP_006851754.1 AT-hook motif nuclear-localized protein 1 [Amborella trichopoda]